MGDGGTCELVKYIPSWTELLKLRYGNCNYEIQVILYLREQFIKLLIERPLVETINVGLYFHHMTIHMVEI